jgi:4-hydroxy-tetrahydrodipicolinate synthase
MIPALKATIAAFTRDETWTRLRPPLVELSAGQRRALARALEGHGFSMPGLADAR